MPTVGNVALCWLSMFGAFVGPIDNICGRFPAETLAVHVGDFGAAAVDEPVEVVTALSEAG